MTQESYTMKEFIYNGFKNIDDKLVEMMKHLDNMRDDGEERGKRISSLENSRSYLWGAIAVLIILGGSITFLLNVYLDSRIDNRFRSPENKQFIIDSVTKALKDNVASVEYEN